MAGITETLALPITIGSDGNIRLQAEDPEHTEPDPEDLARRRRLAGHSERAIQPGGPGTPWQHPEPTDSRVKMPWTMATAPGCQWMGSPD